MEHDADSEILQALALGKQVDTEQWPGLLSRIINRLEKIILEVFPAPPSQYQFPELLPKPLFADKDGASTVAGDSDTVGDDAMQKEDLEDQRSRIPSLPVVLQSVHRSIIKALHAHFSRSPPHTIQRFAELMLFPQRHYRSTSSFLHALDRIVHVTSPATNFPLPLAAPYPSSFNSPLNLDPMSISWGNAVSKLPGAPSIGTDEALGGALLTPISWLKNSGRRSPHEGEVMTQRTTKIIEGPNGPGGVETVMVSINGVNSATTSPTSSLDEVVSSLRAEGGITQGELLRQEQEAGVVPTAQLKDRSKDRDEQSHARGPDDIDIEDMGPQWKRSSGILMQGIDIEAAVGRRFYRDAEVDEEMAGGALEDELVENKTSGEGSPSEDSNLKKREAPEALPCDTIKRSRSCTNPPDGVFDVQERQQS